MLPDINKGLLLDQAKLSRNDAQKLADELAQIGEKRWSELEKAITDTTRKGLGSLDLPRQSQLQALKRRIDSVEKGLSAIKAAAQRTRADE